MKRTALVLAAAVGDPKVVIIVGATHGTTSSYRTKADRADSVRAEHEGSDLVIRGARVVEAETPDDAAERALALIESFELTHELKVDDATTLLRPIGHDKALSLTAILSGGHALLIDCRTLIYEHVPLRLAEAEPGALVAVTIAGDAVPRRLRRVGSCRGRCSSGSASRCWSWAST